MSPTGATARPHRLLRLLIPALLVLSLLAACGSGGTTKASDEKSGVLRVGFQKYGWESLAKTRGIAGVPVQWVEFPSGPALTEALNAGDIDVGEVGEAPPVFAAAARVPFKIIGSSSPAPEGEALLVQKDSPIRSVADLRGKKIALNKGSNVHYFLIKLLQANGLTLNDVDVQYLTPSDGRAAFDSKRIDAWAIWDPYAAIAETEVGARQIDDGTGLVDNHQYFLASDDAVKDKAEQIRQFLGQIKTTADWGIAHPAERAALLAPVLGVPVAALELAANRSKSPLVGVDDRLLASEQQVADTFADLKLIPGKVDVHDFSTTAFSDVLR
jgi:sulfonate transport system substrate-binding protein